MTQRTSLKKLPPPMRDLVIAATRARERAYAPYSHFSVGAAVAARSGAIFVGCNIENSSFPVTICAERVALASAIAAGEREFEAIALIAETDKPLSPCGMCRQVFVELAPNATIIMANLGGDILLASTNEILRLEFALRGEGKDDETN